MQIADGWVHEDHVTGLRLAVTKGKALDHLRITGVPGEHPRDFFFTKDGAFDGTGSLLVGPVGPPAPEPKAAKALAALVLKLRDGLMIVGDEDEVAPAIRELTGCIDAYEKAVGGQEATA